MAKQQIEIEVDIPEGYEATGEFRSPRQGDFILWNGPYGWAATKHNHNDSDVTRLILRRKEPLAIQACRAVLRYHADNRTNGAWGTQYASVIDDCLRAIDEYERGQKP